MAHGFLPEVLIKGDVERQGNDLQTFKLLFFLLEVLETGVRKKGTCFHGVKVC
jgi:hypothetical protein